jgi:molybdenum cofactor guanylyltransferase
MPIRPEDVTAVILAGGRGERMGGVDKGLLLVDDKPLIQHSIDALVPLIHQVIINANRHLEKYRRFGHPVVEDIFPDFAGPLAGIASSMRHVETGYMLVVPCDTPGINNTLVERLVETANASQRQIAVAHDGNELQPAHLLLPANIQHEIDTYLVLGGRGIRDWLKKYDYAIADFSDQPGMFRDIDSPKDLDESE